MKLSGDRRQRHIGDRPVEHRHDQGQPYRESRPIPAWNRHALKIGHQWSFFGVLNDITDGSIARSLEPIRRRAGGSAKRPALIHIETIGLCNVQHRHRISKCLRPDCKYAVRRNPSSFPSSRGDPAAERPRARIWKSKTFEGNRTACCCVYVRFADGGRYASANGRGTVETRRRLRGVVRHRCNSLLRSPINSAGRTRNPMLAALARSGRKSTGPASAPLASCGQEVAALQKFLHRAQTQAGARASTLHQFAPAPNRLSANSQR